MRHRSTYSTDNSLDITNKQSEENKKKKIKVGAGIHSLYNPDDVDDAVRKALAGVTGSRVDSMRTKNKESIYIYKGRPKIISIPSGGMNKRR